MAQKDEKGIWALIKKHPSLYLPILTAIIAPTVFYLIAFGKYGLSTSSINWSNFSGFINLFIGIANLYIFFILSVKVYEYNKKRDDINDDFQESLERPVCVFIPNGKTEQNLDKWKIQNVGRGAALNLHIGVYENGSNKWNKILVKAYSLEANGEIELKWLNKKQCNKLIVFYGSVISSKGVYCTIGDGDRSIIVGTDGSENELIDSLKSEELFFHDMGELIKYSNVKRVQQAIEEEFPNGQYSWA